METDGIIRGIILSVLPVAELRGGIPVAIASGMDWYIAFIICLTANVLVIFPIFFFLDYIHSHFTKFRFYDWLFSIYLERVRKKVEMKLKEHTWEYLVLFLFVAIPLPGTGAYTGCLVSWFFQMDRRKSIVTIVLGVFAAAIVVTLVTTIAKFSFLRLFIKE